MDPETGTMIREGVEAIVNPLDLYAIETAARLQEQYGGETVCITMGPPSAEKAIREAIAMGVDTGILITDRKFAGADTWSTSYVLSEVIRKISEQSPFDLIICGERATDGDTGQVGPGIAGFLDLPAATYVGRIESVDPEAGVCRCHRLVEDGHEVLDVCLPALVTVVKEIGVPRLPTLRSKQKSRTVEIDTLSSADLDLDEAGLGLKGSPTRVVKIFKPKVARECEILKASDEESMEHAADRVVEFLRQKELI
jgi:electron transfer flavoprotein beta subunit